MPYEDYAIKLSSLEETNYIIDAINLYNSRNQEKGNRITIYGFLPMDNQCYLVALSDTTRKKHARKWLIKFLPNTTAWAVIKNTQKWLSYDNYLCRYDPTKNIYMLPPEVVNFMRKN